MNADEAQKLISAGEGQRSEFKRAFAEDNEAIRSLCAFTHAEGGTVFFGVANNGKVTGISVGQNTLENFANNLRRHTNPPMSASVHELGLEGRTIVAAIVRPAERDQIFYAFNLPYIRVGKTNQVMSPEEQRVRLTSSVPPNRQQSQPPSVTRSDVEAIKERRAHFKDLNARTANLDSQRINDAKDGVLKAYLKATIPRRVARISQQRNPDSRFVRVGLWEMRRVEDFNDVSFL